MWVCPGSNIDTVWPEHWPHDWHSDGPVRTARPLSDNITGCGSGNLYYRPGLVAERGIAAARALAKSVVVSLGILVCGPLASLFVAGWLAMLFSRVWGEKAQSGRRRLLASRLILSGVTALSMALTVAPMAIANARMGVYAVSSNAFPIAFFRGNHRDTFGINEYLTDRERLARLRAGGEQNFVQETLLDIRADPGQWLQLLVHKAGLFWTGHEHGDG